MTSITFVIFLPVTPSGSLFGFPLASAIILKAACDPKIFFFESRTLNAQWRKLTNEREGKLEQKFEAAFGKKYKN
jgi:hypothetical protein